MEALFLGVACVISLLLSIVRVSVDKNFLLLYLLFILLYFAVVRTEGYDLDINVYSRLMQSELVDFAFIREPVIWHGQRLLYSILKDSTIVFIAFDVVLFICLGLAFRHFGLPAYSFFAALIYLPFFIGYQNIYRQFTATILMISAFSTNGYPRIIFFLFAVLSHNIALVFLPLVFAVKYFRKSQIILFGVFLYFIFIYIKMEKVDINTGNDFSFLFVLFIFVISLILYDQSRFRFHEFRYYHLYATISCIAAYLSLSSGEVERIAYFFLGVTFPFLVVFIEKFRPAWLLRVLFISLSSFLTFFVGYKIGLI